MMHGQKNIKLDVYSLHDSSEYVIS